MVVVDRLSKIAHSIPIVSTLNIFGLTELFMREIFKHHGISCEMICHRNRKLVSEFWTTLLKFYGTKIKLNIAYHPETDRQTKRTNRTLEDMLRMYIGKKQHL